MPFKMGTGMVVGGVAVQAKIEQEAEEERLKFLNDHVRFTIEYLP